MAWYGYLIFFFVFIFLIWMYIGLQIAISIVTPHVKTLGETMLEESKRDPSLIPYLKAHRTKKYHIKSKYGYQIAIYEFIEYKDSKKFVVMSHGYTYSYHGTIKYALMMIKLGYNVIMYDQRFHGDSGGKNTSLGFHEKNDLYSVISFIFDKYGHDIFLGTYGESMGAATCLLEQAMDKRVRFVISDSSFKNLKILIKSQIKAKGIPTFLFYGIVNIFVWLISRSNLSKVSPIDAIKESDIPMMFVHGKQDDFIPYAHSVDLYEAYKGKKTLYLADKDAYHARSYYNNKEDYFKTLKEFSDQYLKY
ncbi:alpha/beta hydrolase [Mycoplasmatota bacterium]|nr:alpha/beta hydrolase [Mycoplasmatota bacterium]